MMKSIRPEPHHLEAAGEWLLRDERGLTDRDAERLEAWLATDPRHRAAYAAVGEADLELERHGAEDALAGMRRAALKARPERRRVWPALAAGLVAAVLAAGSVTLWRTDALPDRLFGLGAAGASAARYDTVAGERATVSLADGSVLTLNTDSAAEVVFDGQTRTVRLVRGQAFFTVAHDRRPFDVWAGDRRVTAVGTAFDVRVMADELRVAMLDGVVRVSSTSAKPGRPAPVQTLSAGEVMTARAGGAITIRKADTERLVGWRDGMVYFDETPLAEAVAEMNRYASRPMAVADASAGALRVSGAFRIAEADTFAQTVSDIFPLSIKHSADGRTVLASAPA